MEVVGTDRYGTLVVTRLTTQEKQQENKFSLEQEHRDIPQPASAAENLSASAEVVDFDGLIKMRAAESWARLPSARSGLLAVLKIEMLPDGSMNSVSVTESSGDEPYDKSVAAAVRSVERLPDMKLLTPSEF